ncbi:UNVERIFIED_CONTAM: hypothetical protein FKN15_041912 [Acipenser sinensis]
MSPQRFDALLSSVGPLLRKETTRLWEPISEGQRLAVTLSTHLLQRSTSQKLQDLCSRRSLRLRDLVTPFPAELTQTANWNGFCAESARHKHDL